MSWKKRGKKGWTGKKTAKNDTKGRERQYADQEIRQQIQEDFEGDDYRYNYHRKKQNEIARLEYSRDLYQRWANEGRESWWGADYQTQANHYQKQIDELKKK